MIKQMINKVFNSSLPFLINNTRVVTNKTGETQQTFMGNIILLDKKNNEIGRIPVRISTMEAGETRDIEATITESYANAFNFKLEK